jgi:hypothetical protein
MKKQRRDLLKASLSAPVIATICSGSAYAASSSHCAMNAAQQSPQPKAAVTSVDEWLRQTVTVFKSVPGSNKHSPSLNVIAGGGYFLGSDNYWYKIASLTNPLPEKTLATNLTNPSSMAVPYSPAKSINVLYYVDTSHYQKIVYGPAKAPNGTQAIPGSCWMSVI